MAIRTVANFPERPALYFRLQEICKKAGAEFEGTGDFLSHKDPVLLFRPTYGPKAGRLLFVPLTDATPAAIKKAAQTTQGGNQQ